jgi:transporter family-2 protein
MKLLFLFIAAAFGALAPTQAGVNMKLRDYMGDPILAAFVSFAVGTVLLLGYALIARTEWPTIAELSRGPWWMWTGGLMGAFFVASAVIIAPVLGAGTMMCWMIAGQILASLYLDHFGLLGYAVREISPMRVLGALLVVVGAILVKKF